VEVLLHHYASGKPTDKYVEPTPLAPPEAELMLVLGERHLRRILTRYLAYYHQARTHLALDKDALDTRPIELPVTEQRPAHLRHRPW
jgi:hypothetical protein